MTEADHNKLLKHWQQATSDINNHTELKSKYYKQLVSRYSSFRRKYHNLNHIAALLNYVEQYESELSNPNEIRLAIWYHDAVYRPLKKDNEVKSAVLAKNHLSQLQLNPDSITRIEKLIEATADHYLPEHLNDFDSQFFMDIDLSILGAPREKYVAYMWQVRKELVLVPRFMYKKGRVKALEQLLGLRYIYKTELFQPLEKQARENMQLEARYWQYI